MAGIETVVPWAVVTGVAGWFGKAFIEWLRSSNDRHTADRSADAKLEEHRDGLTFQLLEAARIELAELRSEVHRLRPMESHLLHFEEALRCLESLLLAETPSEVTIARRNATAFLNRIKRVREATGTLLNEVQRVDSTVALLERMEGRKHSPQGKDEKGGE